MCTLTAAAARRLGKRATAYVEGCAFEAGSVLLVPDKSTTPDGIARTLTRVYGRAMTIDRGETAFWSVPRSHVQREIAPADIRALCNEAEAHGENVHELSERRGADVEFS